MECRGKKVKAKSPENPAVLSFARIHILQLHCQD